MTTHNNNDLTPEQIHRKNDMYAANNAAAFSDAPKPKQETIEELRERMVRISLGFSA